MGRGMHGLKATMLADPSLEVIERFGYRNKNINNFKRPGVEGLPVPTTLLIDTDGRVVWKDQSADYTQRSDPNIVSAAISKHFPTNEY